MLLDGVEEQKEARNIVYDLDGIIFLSCYKHKEADNIELMYADLFMRIHAIESEVWREYQVNKSILAITSKKNFRHGLTGLWKADRKAKPEREMTDKQLASHIEAKKLRTYVSQVKVLLKERMSSSPSFTVVVSAIAEADDTVIDLANNHDYLVVAMDSDIIKQSKSPVFNFHSKHWKWVTKGNADDEIFLHIIHDTITGGHNGSFGVKGSGKVAANKFIQKLEDGEKSFTDWVELFETPADALLNYQVADCSQVMDGKLKLIEMIEISQLFEEHLIAPF